MNTIHTLSPIRRKKNHRMHILDQQHAETLQTAINRADGKDCSSCTHCTIERYTCKCKMKGNKQVKPYNICHLHTT